MTPRTIFLLRMCEPGSSLTVTLRGGEVSREGRVIHRPEASVICECYRDSLIVPDGGKFVITSEGRTTALRDRNQQIHRRAKRVVN